MDFEWEHFETKRTRYLILTGIKLRWFNWNKSISFCPSNFSLPSATCLEYSTQRGVGEGGNCSFSFICLQQMSNYTMKIWISSTIQCADCDSYEGLAQSWQMQITDRNNENKCLGGGMVASQKWTPFFSVRLSIMWPPDKIETKSRQNFDNFGRERQWLAYTIM